MRAVHGGGRYGFGGGQLHRGAVVGLHCGAIAYLALAGCSSIYAAFILVLGGLSVAARGFLLSAAPKRSASARVRFCLSSFSFLFFGSKLAAGQAVAGWLLGLLLASLAACPGACS